jgi:hypothetical protein
MASVIKKRIAALEVTQQRRTSRRALSSARRKYLTDKAVLEGDQEALNELDRHRSPIIHVDPTRRAAALAAGLRADL